MRKFEVSMLHDLQLSSVSSVLIVGGYDGVDAVDLWSKYDCDIAVLEPIPQFYDECQKRFEESPIRLLPFALSSKSCLINLGIKGNMSGLYASGESVSARGIRFGQLLNVLGWYYVDHLKLNCEGMEYEILEDMIESQYISKADSIHVQFHSVIPDCQSRYEKIAEQLSKTHELDFRDPFIWEGWIKKI